MAKPVANFPNIEDQWRGVSSVYPCTEYITFGPWIYMVPQYKPKSVLMLGYAGGTTAGLIRMFHGDVPITAVDVDDCSEFNFYDVELIQADAQEWIKTAGEYDTIIVDIYGRDPEPPDFIFSKEFVSELEKRCNYLIVDATEKSDMSAYKHLNKVKTLHLNRNRFHYFTINNIPSLPIR